MKDEYPLDSESHILVIDWVAETHLKPLHWHTCLEIGLCTGGKGWFYFADKQYEVQAGDIFIVNNVERHMTQADANDPNRYYFVKFDPSVLAQQEKELLLPFVYDPKRFNNKISRDHPIAQKIGTLIQTMWEESQERNSAYKVLLRSTLTTICVLLLRHFETHVSEKDWKQVMSQFLKLQPALIYIQQHFREPIELNDIAEQISLSPSRTYHLFKEAIGKGFKEYVNMLRIHEAKSLLIETNLPITEICYTCGFQSHTPFYRAFKHMVGMNPQEYRDKYSVLQLIEHFE